MRKPEEIASKLLGVPYAALDERANTVARHVAERTHIARNMAKSQKDRLSAEHDYEVNLKAELEIMLQHETFDLLREKQWDELPVIQKEQLKLLSASTQPSA